MFSKVYQLMKEDKHKQIEQLIGNNSKILKLVDDLNFVESSIH